VTQLLRQGDSQVFKRYSQMKLQMKREALEKINRQANEMPVNSGTAMWGERLCLELAHMQFHRFSFSNFLFPFRMAFGW
jgi:hypothetical protein